MVLSKRVSKSKVKGVKVKTFDFGSGEVPAHQHLNPDGSIGGWVANTASVAGTAWVSGDAQVYDSACVFGTAQVFENADVFDSARVSGDAQVCGNAQVYKGV